MWHREKTIGHSSYSVVKYGDKFRIKEVYAERLGFITRYSEEHWDNVHDALTQLALISCERHYTDPSKYLKF